MVKGNRWTGKMARPNRMLVVLALVLVPGLFFAIAASTVPALGHSDDRTAAESWETQVVEPQVARTGTGNFPYSDIAVDADNVPHISYYDSVRRDLKYAYLSSSGWQTETVDSSSDDFAIVGSSNAIGIDSNGDPYISYLYWDSPEMWLKLAVRNGASWVISHVELLDGTMVFYDNRFFSDLELDENDNVHLVYLKDDASQAFNRLLRYATIANGSVVSETIEGIGLAPIHVIPYFNYRGSLALGEGGAPHVSYLHEDSVQMRYAHKVASEWMTETVDSDGINIISSLELDSNGQPHLTYLNAPEVATGVINLKYAKKLTNTWEITDLEQVVDPQEISGNSSVLDGDDQLHVASGITSGSGAGLIYLEPVSSGWHTVIVDQSEHAGAFPTMILDGDGSLHIVHFEWSNIGPISGDLKYSRCSDACGSTLAPSHDVYLPVATKG